MKPTLVEPGTRYFIGGVLRNCCNTKTNIVNWNVNVILILIFIGFISSIIYLGSKKERTLNNSQMSFDTYMKNKITSLTSTPSQFQITNLPKFDTPMPFVDVFHNGSMSHTPSHTLSLSQKDKNFI